MSELTLLILGLADVEVKPFGPVQLKVAPLAPVAVRLRVLPEQSGLLLPGVGAAGCVVIDTVVVPGYEGHVLLVLITTQLYTPAANPVTLVIDGFCSVLLKPFGPVHE